MLSCSTCIPVQQQKCQIVRFTTDTRVISLSAFIYTVNADKKKTPQATHGFKWKQRRVGVMVLLNGFT